MPSLNFGKLFIKSTHREERDNTLYDPSKLKRQYYVYHAGALPISARQKLGACNNSTKPLSKSFVQKKKKKSYFENN